MGSWGRRAPSINSGARAALGPAAHSPPPHPRQQRQQRHQPAPCACARQRCPAPRQRVRCLRLPAARHETSCCRSPQPRLPTRPPAEERQLLRCLPRPSCLGCSPPCCLPAAAPAPRLRPRSAPQLPRLLWQRPCRARCVACPRLEPRPPPRLPPRLSHHPSPTQLPPLQQQQLCPAWLPQPPPSSSCRHPQPSCHRLPPRPPLPRPPCQAFAGTAQKRWSGLRP